MKILFEIAGRPITLYGVMTAAALLVFWLIGWCWLKNRKVTAGAAVGWMVSTAVFGWLISRVVFVLCNAAYYIDELDGCWTPALYFWDGGYSMIGLLAGMVLGAWLTAVVSGASRNHLLNGVGIAAPLPIALLRLTEFLCDTEHSGDIGEGKFLEGSDWFESFLERTGLLMQADGDYVYPACLALFAAMLAIFVAMVVWYAARRGDIPNADGLTVMLLLYGSVMMVLEQLRDDGHLVFHFVHLEQVLALVMGVLCLAVWTKRFASARIKRPTLLVIWAIVLVCIGVAIAACFGIDRWENKVLAWLLLIVPVIVLAGSSLYLRLSANYLTGEK